MHLISIQVKRSPSEWDWGHCSLVELHEWEQEKEKEKNIKSKRKLWEIHSKKESDEWKEKESFFFSQVESLSVVIFI